MKNIAIPLLLAGSAKAEAKKKAAMLLDYAVPEPILIASSWTGDVCVDAAGDVAEALSELQAAQGDLEELEEGIEALEEAEDDAIAARILAIADVVELDEEMESDVAANNSAIADLIGLKEAWQEANVDASIGEALVATRLQAQSDAEGDYDQAVIDYAGFTPTAEGLADGEVAVAGLLSVTEGLAGELDDAQETETGIASVAGSIANRNAAHVDYASKNCSSATDSGAAGANLVVQCGGTFQNAEATDYSAYTQSLQSLEDDVDDNLGLADTASLTMAAKKLLKVEYNQIQKYLGYAVANSAQDMAESGTETKSVTIDAVAYTETDWDASTNYIHYPGTPQTILTQAEIVGAMTSGNTNLAETAHGLTGAVDSKSYTWVKKLQLVYGATPNTSTDGNGVDASEAYTIVQTSSTAGSEGAGAWVTAASAKADALSTYITTYNANVPAGTTTEIDGTDGYGGAYTELEASTTNSGICSTSTSGITGALAGLTPNVDFDQGGAGYTLGWATGVGVGDDSSTIGGSGDSTLKGNSICAKKCSSLVDWVHNAGTNLPESGAGANTQCTGFEVDISAGAGTTAVECTLYYGALPEIDAGVVADSSDIECWKRNFSSEAAAYVNAALATVAGDGSDPWDYFDTAATNWDTAYKNLIDARAELDIAVRYNFVLNPIYDDTTAVGGSTYSYAGYSQQYDYTTGGVTTGALIEYTNSETAHTDAVTDWTNSETTYSSRAVEIASANSDYVMAQALWEENNALISKLTVLHEIANDASNAALLAEEAADDALEQATDDWQDAVDAYDGVEASGEVAGSTGLVELQTDAQEAYDDAFSAIYGEEGSDTGLGEYEDGGDGDLGSLFGLRAAAVDAYEELTDAMEDLMDLNGEIMGAQGDVEEAMAEHLAAIVACKVENYDAYTETLQLAQQQREDDLDDILALVTEAEEDEPAAGAAGSRCEKALSNGTFRPQRGEGTCNEGLCCGAARIPMGEVTMTVETCQAIDTTTYSYVPARGPMATAAPAAEVVDFVCIDGAKKLAAAASALATAVYMLA